MKTVDATRLIQSMEESLERAEKDSVKYMEMHNKACQEVCHYKYLLGLVEYESPDGEE